MRAPFKSLRNRQNSGFTIIEILIVLAIAAFILLIVLVAVPQLQKNSRDSSRQSVLTRVKAELDNYASNNQGAYPFTAATGSGSVDDFNSRYIDTQTGLKNPSNGKDYTVEVASSGTADPSADQILVYPGMSCQGESTTGTFVAVGASNTSKKYALRLVLDNGNTYYCVDNGA